jgi:hypothetical protein
VDLDRGGHGARIEGTIDAVVDNRGLNYLRPKIPAHHPKNGDGLLKDGQIFLVANNPIPP